MYDRTAIMRAAWACYRNVRLPRFCRERFRIALRVSWTAARFASRA